MILFALLIFIIGILAIPLAIIALIFGGILGLLLVVFLDLIIFILIIRGFRKRKTKKGSKGKA